MERPADTSVCGCVCVSSACGIVMVPLDADVNKKAMVVRRAVCFFIKCVLLIKILFELRSIAFESDDFIIKKEKIFSIDLARNGGK